ncbi:tetratricopeptide repeat-containing response regulator [Pseudomonas sp. OIL-1]|uniref:tetratricopeptide repeat-containing response regulator n=1 Tax=Pseudomonas sp. OIL-1 TaxID=2706126 RepID=UPI0013A7AB2E|nr:tetratricopeptide repeat-containing response regulator [Pseudomonas sp. OIL-1]QIB50490.1 response regulator [Pseudomonas sp. OIL-1]
MIDYSNKRVLIADDFSGFRTSVTGMLRQMAVRDVDAVATGEETLALCRNTRYDVILHDYNLGDGKNGQQVLEELHHTRRISPHCIFVMVTAESSQAMVMAALECEPDAYLTKPFNRASLEQRLEKLFQRKAALKPILDAISRDDPQAVVSACRTMIQAQPRLAPLCQRYLADALAQLGQATELESLLNGLVGDRPLPWALVAQGNHLRSKGRLDEAQALYEKGIELFPMLPALFDGLSAIHDARGDSLAAQQYLEKGIRISPHALQRQVELGRLARRNDDYAQATRAFRQAVGLGRNSAFRNPETHLQLAATLTEQDGPGVINPKVLLEIRQTLAEVDKTWKNDPALIARSNLLQGSALAKNGQKGEAERYAQMATERLESLEGGLAPELALDMARQLRELGRADSADAVLSTCAEMYGDDPAILEQIAEQTDNPDIIKAGEHAKAQNREGIKRYQQKQFAEALELFRQASASQPRNISYALNTAQSLLRLLAQTPDDDLKAECLRCLAQAHNMPATDKRYERYQKLRKAADAL